MAGYKHQTGHKYTPEQIERIRRIQEMADEALTIRERALQAEKRIEERRLKAALTIEQLIAGGSEAQQELARIQREHPQPAGIGAKRMARFLREENAYKAEKATRSMVGESYDIAA